MRGVINVGDVVKINSKVDNPNWVVGMDATVGLVGLVDEILNDLFCIGFSDGRSWNYPPEALVVVKSKEN